MAEREDGIPEEVKNWKAPDESQLVEDIGKAHAMAEAGKLWRDGAAQNRKQILQNSSAEIKSDLKRSAEVFDERAEFEEGLAEKEENNRKEIERFAEAVSLQQLEVESNWLHDLLRDRQEKLASASSQNEIKMLENELKNIKIRSPIIDRVLEERKNKAA
jgi:hypothetical protein